VRAIKRRNTSFAKVCSTMKSSLLNTPYGAWVRSNTWVQSCALEDMNPDAGQAALACPPRYDHVQVSFGRGCSGFAMNCRYSTEPEYVVGGDKAYNWTIALYTSHR
jgi:hypothetical protein